MTITSSRPTADSSVTLQVVRPQSDRRAKVKRFLNALLRSLAAGHM
jgi:hypothetical protein